MDLWSMVELELYDWSQVVERGHERADPVPPPKATFGTVWRRRLAQGLIGLGLRLDADASRAALRPETAAQLNGSDA